MAPKLQNIYLLHWQEFKPYCNAYKEALFAYLCLHWLPSSYFKYFRVSPVFSSDLAGPHKLMAARTSTCFIKQSACIHVCMKFFCINSEKCIEYGIVATVRSINHNVGALKELSIQI